MTGRYLDLGKFALLLLAIATPLLLYQGYRNRKELLLRDASLRASLTEERNAMVWRFTQGFFTDPQQLESAVLTRPLPSGMIMGLPPFPSSGAFARLTGLETHSESSVSEILNDHLFSRERFFSGMPKRYAAMVEILTQEKSRVTNDQFERLYQVTAAFYSGQEVDDGTLAFLMAKLPDSLMPLFIPHRKLLALESSAEVPTVLLELDNKRYLLEPESSTIDILNSTLAALDLDTAFQPGAGWQTWQGLETTLSPQPQPSKPLRQTALFYLAAGAALEFLLFTLYAILVKYAKINHAQKQLLATTSHELRTPLAVMRQFAEMLVDRSHRLPEKVRPYHSHILRECLRMQFLVENLLSAAKFENVTFEPQPETVDLSDWLEDIVRSMERLTDKEIRMVCPQVRVSWDPGMMEQVIVNLLENARIHAGTDVEIQATQGDEDIALVVRDFGMGADLHNLRKIKAFKARDAQKGSAKSGLGLGLYLVQRIVQAHGGSVTFSNADPGFEVNLHLPHSA